MRTATTTHDHYVSRLEDLREAMEPDEDGDNRTHELPLSIERETVWRIVLGTGGPHDEVRVSVDEHGEVTGGSYVYRWSGMNGDGEHELDRDEAQEWADAFGLEEV